MRLAVVLAAIALAACADQGPGDDAHHVDTAFIRQNLLDAPPAAITRPIEAHFQTPGGGEIVYFGYDLATPTVAPGDKITITHYWKVVHAPGPGWRIFEHVVGDGDDYANVDGSEMRMGHPVEAWKDGEIIRDPQTFALAPGWKSKSAVIELGFYQAGKHRIADRADVVGGTSADRALSVVTLAVDLSKAPPPPGTLILKKAAGPITIDGKADDPGWRGAAEQTAFDVADGCPDMPDATSAKMTWDDQYLYVFVSSEDADVFSPFTNHDDTLWKNDVVEVFIDADGNHRGYIELQVSPRNVTFDTWWAIGRGANGPTGDPSFESGMKTAAVVRGTLDNRDDGDAGWDVEIAIPLAAARGKDPDMKINVPPHLGDLWHLNVVRSDMPKDGRQTAASWNRITCSDFHALDRMLVVQFADHAGNVVPAPTPPPAPEMPPTPAPVPIRGAPAVPVPAPAPATPPMNPHAIQRVVPPPAGAPKPAPVPAAPKPAPTSP